VKRIDTDADADPDSEPVQGRRLELACAEVPWMAMLGRCDTSAPVDADDRKLMTTHRGIRPSTTESTAALWIKSLLNAALFFLVFMIVLPWLSHWALPSRLPLPFWPRTLVGGTLILAGVALWIVCLDVFSRRGSGTPFPLDAPRKLVTSGPYAIVRNPIMTGELAVIWGEAILVSSLGVWLYAVLITVAAHLAVVLIEEPELRQRFGDAYEEYCRRVPRWLPSPSRAPRSA
jgi:protein-S-isoprenylcysteine O-methyltransferase Ste14